MLRIIIAAHMCASLVVVACDGGEDTEKGDAGN